MSDTATDLHRYFRRQWCPVHGFNKDDPLCCPKCRNDLHTRDPRTKVEGLRFLEGRWFILREDDEIPRQWVWCSPAHAADLLVMGVVKEQWESESGDLFQLLAEVDEIQGKDSTISFPEAVAIAYHRMLDAEENADG